MRGSIIQRYPGSFSVIVDTYITDPETGARKRKQLWYTLYAARAGTLSGNWQSCWVNRILGASWSRKR